MADKRLEPVSDSAQEQLAIHPLASLLRGFAVDFITGHDVDVVERIMTPDYTLTIGGFTLSGRDGEYLPPTAAQINQFPGLCVTVHDVVYGERALAMQFTEHGASSRDGGRGATWRGVTLFRTDGERLQRGWAEEDYYARKRQLASGSCDLVDAPHAMPWDIPVAPANPDTDTVAKRWLSDAVNYTGVENVFWCSQVDAQDPLPLDLVQVHSTEIDEFFSAGNRAAFHVTHHGTYIGGFSDVDPAKVGTDVVFRAAGLLTVADGRVVAARITHDRLGLNRSLRFD